jgi:hypothetical protein
MDRSLELSTEPPQGGSTARRLGTDPRTLDHLPRPFIVAVVTEPTVTTARRVMAAAARDGAGAFELNLPPLHDASRRDLAGLIAEAPAPVYTSCRRRGFMAVYGYDPEALPAWSDDERMERQLDAVELGAVALDLELDTFAPSPAPALGSPEARSAAEEPGPPFELTDDEGAIARQEAIVRAVRARGAQALLSCHTGRPQDLDGLLRIAAIAAARGADLLKIVTPCRDAADLSVVLEASRTLAGAGSVPFTLVGAGAAGRVSRWIGGATGSSWLLARPRGASRAYADQPTVAELAVAARAIRPAGAD